MKIDSKILKTSYAALNWLRCMVMGLVCLLGMPGANAQSKDLISERAWLEDHTGTMTLEDVQQSSAWRIKTGSPIFNMGYGPGAVWFRLRIDGSGTHLAADSPLMMRIRPSYLDDLTLFDPLQSPQQQPSIGDRHPKLEGMETSTFLTYALPAGEKSRHVWVRLQSTSTRMAQFEVMTPSALQESNWLIEKFGTFYLSVLFVFIGWGLIQLTVQMDKLIAIFVVYQMSALFFGACMLGYTAVFAEKWLWPSSIDMTTSTMAVISTYMVSLFANQVLLTLRKNRWRNYFNAAVHCAFLTCMVLIVTSQIRTALQLNMALIFFLPWFYWCIAVFTPLDKREAQTISKATMVTYFSVTLAITLMTSMPALNLIPATEFSHYIVSFYSVCSGLMMMMIIQYRSVQTIKERSWLSAQTLQANQQAIQEREFRQETEKLLAMLGHELKTPLSTLLLQVNNPKIPETMSHALNRAVTDMSHVIERTIQAGQLEHKKLALVKANCNFPIFLKQLIAAMPEAAQIQVETTDTEDHLLYTDVYLLNMIIRNLLDNALKYGVEGALVKVQLQHKSSPSEWHLTVSNSIGRAGRPDPSKVFEKYYRNPAAAYRTGTGLGLFLVNFMAKQLDCRIEYQPQEDRVDFLLITPTCSNE